MSAALRSITTSIKLCTITPRYWHGEIHDPDHLLGQPEVSVYGVVRATVEEVQTALAKWLRPRLGILPGEPLPDGMLPEPSAEDAEFHRLVTERHAQRVCSGRRRLGAGG